MRPLLREGANGVERAVSEGRLCAAVRAYVRRAERRQTPAEIAATIGKLEKASIRSVRGAIKRLLSRQDLVYAYEMGCSFLIENTHRPWRASPRIWILPPERSHPEILDPSEVVIRMQAGASFGGDGHPTTRLCLQALDHLSGGSRDRTCFRGPALDIGTGSGVLALAAAKLGSPSVLALDTDPCARWEASANVALNHLESRIRIGPGPFEQLTEGYHLILANLRYPTLLRLLPWARRHLDAAGRLVVSGFLKTEAPALEAHFRAGGLALRWSGSRKRWAAGSFALNGAEG
jgi:ribosomal protein L11 methyltransferase